MKIEKLSKKNRPEAKLWNEKKKPHEGTFFRTYFHSITPHSNKQGRK